MRSIAFTMLTPFYFIKAGLYVSLPALIPTAGLVVILLGIKMLTKFVGVWPLSYGFGIPSRERMYTTMLMSTGLTFGTISALFGLENRIISQAQYTVLVTSHPERRSADAHRGTLLPTRSVRGEG